MLFEGLMSSSPNTGSRTETGLGFSGISIVISRSATLLVVKELDGDPGGDNCNWLSSSESWKSNINDCQDEHI